MKRAIHIFKKDTVRLWPQIQIFVATLIALIIEDAIYSDSTSYGLLYLGRVAPVALLMVSCWLLVTGLIHEEKSVGLTHYWLTRPFSRRDLLAADALFLIAFVHVPVFVCQAIVLSANGLSPLEYLGDLVAKQVFLAALLVLPMAAVASVTKNLGHAFLAGLSVLLVLVIAGVGLGAFFPNSHWEGLEWIRISAKALVVASGAAAVLWIQYTRRRTGLASCLMAATIVAVVALSLLPPWQPAFVMQSWLSQRKVGSSEVRIVLDRERETPLHGMSIAWGRSVEVDIPIRVESLPAGLDIDFTWIRVQAEGDGLKRWRPGETVSSRRESSGQLWLPLLVNTDYFEEAMDIPVHVSGTIDLTLSVPSGNLAALGHCYSSQTGPGGARHLLDSMKRLDCISPRPRAMVEQTTIPTDLLFLLPRYVLPRYVSPRDYAPYPTSPWFGPLQRFSVPAINIKVEHPVAHIVRTFDFGQLRLAAYRVAMQ